LLVVTNQPDVARGRQLRETVEAMHAAMAAHMPVDDFLVCFHDDRDACPCRKPKPGLLLEGAGRHGIHLAASYMVGDRWRDIDAGAAAGCRTVFLELGRGCRLDSGGSPDLIHGGGGIHDMMRTHFTS
jgi:D-glycero-D-manno-heptose 1,7-bisphosphate phosphatase